jgi:hypothetical protein
VRANDPIFLDKFCNRWPWMQQYARKPVAEQRPSAAKEMWQLSPY